MDIQQYALRVAAVDVAPTIAAVEAAKMESLAKYKSDDEETKSKDSEPRVNSFLVEHLHGERFCSLGHSICFSNYIICSISTTCLIAQIKLYSEIDEQNRICVVVKWKENAHILRTHFRWPNDISIADHRLFEAIDAKMSSRWVKVDEIGRNYPH